MTPDDSAMTGPDTMKAEIPQPRVFVTHHEGRFNGRTVRYGPPYRVVANPLTPRR